MINILENMEKKDSPAQVDKLIEPKDYFNRRLIYPQARDDFNQLYETYYKCLICQDVVFDPVYCSKCQMVFCSSCIIILKNSDINDHKSKGSVICDHSNTSAQLP